MMHDPIVQENRHALETFAARFNFDLAAMVADLQHRTEQERRADREVVSLPVRPAQLRLQSASQNEKR